MVNVSRAKKIKRKSSLVGKSKGRLQRIAKQKRVHQIRQEQERADKARTEKARQKRVERAKAKEAKIQRGKDLAKKKQSKRALTARQEWQAKSKTSRAAAIGRSSRTSRVEVVRPSTGFVNNMPSSWVKSFAYDQWNQVLFMTVKGGKTYEWERISPALAEIIVKPRLNDAECKTDDIMKRKRWWKGKNPSLGATYWKYLSFSRKK